MATKQCSKCEQHKDLSNFGVYTDARNGKAKTRGVCNQCRVRVEVDRARGQRPQRNESNRKWKSNNKDKIRDYERERVRTKRVEDIQYKLCSDVCGRTRTMLKTTQSNKHNNLVGCTPATLKKWLQFQFSKCMNWDNYGEYWEIDHVVPLSIFNMVHKSQQVLACNWTNMRPIQVEVNKLKSNSIQQDVIFEHMLKLQQFVFLNGYQTNIETCWWQRHILWYGQNPENERNYDSFLKWIIRSENNNEEALDSLIV